MWRESGLINRQRGQTRIHIFFSAFPHENVEKPSLGIDIGGDIPDRGCHTRVGFDHILDLADGGENSRMVAVFKLGTDVVQRQIRQRPHEVHCDLTGEGDVLRAVLPAQILRL